MNMKNKCGVKLCCLLKPRHEFLNLSTLESLSVYNFKKRMSNLSDVLLCGEWVWVGTEFSLKVNFSPITTATWKNAKTNQYLGRFLGTDSSAGVHASLRGQVVPFCTETCVRESHTASESWGRACLYLLILIFKTIRDTDF